MLVFALCFCRTRSKRENENQPNTKEYKIVAIEYKTLGIMNTQDPTIHLQTILASYLENEKASSTLETAVPSLLSIIQQHALLTRVPPTSTTTLHQWTTKLNTLLHSKQPGIRWAAILLIGITCEQNRSLFRENVQTWAGLLLGNLNVWIFYFAVELNGWYCLLWKILEILILYLIQNYLLETTTGSIPYDND